MDAPFTLLFPQSSGAPSSDPSDVAAGKAAASGPPGTEAGEVFAGLVNTTATPVPATTATTPATSTGATETPALAITTRPDKVAGDGDTRAEPASSAQNLGPDLDDATAGLTTTPSERRDTQSGQNPDGEQQVSKPERANVETRSPAVRDVWGTLPSDTVDRETDAVQSTNVETTEKPNLELELPTDPAATPTLEAAELPPMLSAELAASALSTSSNPNTSGGADPEMPITSRAVLASGPTPDVLAQPPAPATPAKLPQPAPMSVGLQTDQDAIPGRPSTVAATELRITDSDVSAGQLGPDTPARRTDQPVDASLTKAAPPIALAKAPDTPLTNPQATQDTGQGPAERREPAPSIQSITLPSSTAEVTPPIQPSELAMTASRERQEPRTADAPRPDRLLSGAAIQSEQTQPKPVTDPKEMVASASVANVTPSASMDHRQGASNVEKRAFRLDTGGPSNDINMRNGWPVAPQPTPQTPPTPGTLGTTQPLGLSGPPDLEVRLNATPRDEPALSADMAHRIGPGAPNTSPHLTAAYSAAPPMIGTKQAPATPTPIAASDALDPGTASVSSLSHTTASAPSTPAQAAINSPAIPQQIAHHIATALPKPLSDLGNGTLEIALDPPELGRVRLSLVEVSGTMTLSILADRPETADLMRRNLDILAQEFSRSGLDAPNVRVDTGGAGSGAGTMGNQHGSATDTIQDDHPSETPLEMEAGALPNGTPPPSNRSLDLRL